MRPRNGVRRRKNESRRKADEERERRQIALKGARQKPEARGEGGGRQNRDGRPAAKAIGEGIEDLL